MPAYEIFGLIAFGGGVGAVIWLVLNMGRNWTRSVYLPAIGLAAVAFAFGIPWSVGYSNAAGDLAKKDAAIRVNESRYLGRTYGVTLTKLQIRDLPVPGDEAYPSTTTVTVGDKYLKVEFRIVPDSKRIVALHNGAELPHITSGIIR